MTEVFTSENRKKNSQNRKMIGTYNDKLALYIRYVLRPSKLIHYAQDRGALAQVCRREGINTVAVFEDMEDDPKNMSNIYADWRQLPLQKTWYEDYDERDENTLVLVTKIPYEGIYFTAPVMMENWIKSEPRHIWLLDSNIDRWIIDLSSRSYIVDLDASIHANTELSHIIGKSVILKRTY